MKEVSVFWFVPKNGTPNLGDEFGRVVIEEIAGFKVVKKGLFSCDAISVGSILGWGWEKEIFNKRESSLSVLGSGFMHPDVNITTGSGLKFYGVRGELTKAVLNNNGFDVLGVGDLGLLARDLLNEHDKVREKVHEISFIPHHSSYEYYRDKFSNHIGLNFIDMRTSNYKNVFEDILSSKVVVSESLHGLVFSDSLQVPNVWFKRKDLHVGGEFKFKDYFSSVGRSCHKKVSSIHDISGDNIFDDWQSVLQGVVNTRQWFSEYVNKVL